MALKRIDQVVRWRKTGTNNFGEDQYGAGVVLNLRWDDNTIEATDRHGDPFVAKGVVYSDAVGELLIEDRVIRGDDPLVDISTSYIVKSIKSSRNGAGTRFLFAARLSS